MAAKRQAIIKVANMLKKTHVSNKIKTNKYTSMAKKCAAAFTSLVMIGSFLIAPMCMMLSVYIPII